MKDTAAASPARSATRRPPSGHRWATSAAVAALALLTGTAHAQIVQNPGFEDNFPSIPAVTGVFGTDAVPVTEPNVPEHWVIDSYGVPPYAEWIEAAGYGAGGSDHFVYVPAGNGFCVEPLHDHLTSPILAGQRYELTVSLASADSEQAAIFSAHLSSQQGNWHPLYDSTGTELLRFDTSSPLSADAGNPSLHGLVLGPNAAWIDGAQSTIPWQAYSYVFTAPTSYWDSELNQVVTVAAGQPLLGVTFDFCTSPTGSGAFVIDDVQLTAIAVPEPGSALLLAGAGLFLRRRRR